MWRKPGYESAQPSPVVIEQRGTLLAAIPRGRPNANGDHMEEFRVALDEYQGHPFVSLRLFQRGQDGRMYPVKGKGCSVRLGEGEAVAAAILEALALADSPGSGRSTSPAPRPRQDPRPRHAGMDEASPGEVDGSEAERRATPPWEALPGARGGVEQGDFDEFEEGR